MPEVITPAATNSTVSAPLDGERASAGTLRDLALQPLANRIEYQRVVRESAEAAIRESVPGIASYALKVVPMEWGAGSTTVWSKAFEYEQATVFAEQLADVLSGIHVFTLNITPLIPRTGRISKIGMELYGASGHAAMPTRPRIGLYRVARIHAYNASWTQIAEQADQSADVAAYETPHALDYTLPTAHTFDIVNYKYQLRITGETGANFIWGLRILGARFEIINV